MKLSYILTIDQPETHLVKVKITGSWPAKSEALTFFLPAWSPGSYLIREYSKNIQRFQALDAKGKYLNFIQNDKGSWSVFRPIADAKQKTILEFELNYEVYCHELTVRTSHVDITHAFLHGPTLFMGVESCELRDLELKINFPNCWNKISTGLKDHSIKRDSFYYLAKTYDELLDSPIEIGCHQTDGFLVGDRPHELAFYGDAQFPHHQNLKEDIKTLVVHISRYFGSLPYEKYTFITHFVEGLYGGLEHSNSCALQYSPLDLCSRKGYTRWLELVAHEYFHTWNVKRIRPQELGPFNYSKENYTRMHWLTEGLTSFMDQLFVLRSGLMTLNEYLDEVKESLNRYLQSPGRRMQSLEESSFNAWIKLYRPDENSKNSSISYYLKGGIAFFLLNIIFFKKEKSIDHLLLKLWERYQENPSEGMITEDVLAMIEKIGGKEARNTFEIFIQTTEEWDLEFYLKEMGLSLVWEEDQQLGLGVRCRFVGERVFIKEVLTDSAAYKSGLNVGDEIISIAGVRILKETFQKLSKFVFENHKYSCLISRNKSIRNLELEFLKENRIIKEIKILDENKVLKCLSSLD